MTYEDIEGVVHTGDIVLFSGQRLYQKIIQYVSNSKWNHVGIVFESYGHLFFIEAIGQGVRIQRLEQKCADHKGGLRVMRPRWQNKDDCFEIIKNILNNIGNEYDFRGVISFLIRKIYPKFRWQSNQSQFCSELIANGLQTINYKWTDLPAHLVKPCDFDSPQGFDVVIDIYQINF